MTVREEDRRMAEVCVNCAVCTRARANQKGFAFFLVKFVEGGLCPYCKAYERVYGRKAHEQMP